MPRRISSCDQRAHGISEKERKLVKNDDWNELLDIWTSHKDGKSHKSFGAHLLCPGQLTLLGVGPAEKEQECLPFILLVIITTENHFPSLPSYVPLDTVKHLRTLQSGAATRLIYYTNAEGHLSRLCCQVI